MTTTILIHLAIDLVAILALVAGTYFPRHHRRDLFVALLGVNLAHPKPRCSRGLNPPVSRRDLAM